MASTTSTRGRVVPHVDILLLGSPEVGKATFLSRLQHIRNGSLNPQAPFPSITNPPASPLSFDVTLFNRPYRFHIYTSTSTLFIDPFPSEPAFTIITFSIPDRHTLHNAQFYWRKQLSLHYDYLEHDMPVMLLGLKRDLRTDKQIPREQWKNPNIPEYECIMPQEGLGAAQDMRCDRYAECSAITGELMFEVLEDITRTAAKTTTEAGGLSSGSDCLVM